MSHTEERKEKNCLNCNAVVHGRYCSICGQENLEPQEKIRHLVSHIFNDITHFDGKFFSSLKWLIRKPGFLSEEYVAGRRASYLNPVRMYVFTSFIFFLIFFTCFSGSNFKNNTGKKNISGADSVQVAQALKKEGVDSVPHPAGKIPQNAIVIMKNDFRDRKQYDSLISAGSVKDGFIKQMFMHKQFSLQEKYGDNDELIREQLKENLKHYVPEMFFISLPLFALFLQILYARGRRFYYVAHAIFTLHLYIFVYIAALVLFTLAAISNLPYMGWLDYLLFVLWGGVVFYVYRAMRNFYGQNRWKTLLKFILLLLWLVFILIFLMILMFSLSILKL